MADIGFSGVLRLTDLNDFIGPSQECIKPVIIDKSSNTSGTVKISYDDGNYSEVTATGTKTKLKPAQITLNDCLACSGCVTSAETVLIQQQSTQQLLDVLESKKSATDTASPKHPLVVVSVSPQSRASLAAKYRMTATEAYEHITGFLIELGVDFVFDTTFARHVSLAAEQEEFLARMKERSSTGGGQLPMLASSCPGWICYAEKSHGDWILPRISTVRSPQAIMGVLVKDYLGKKLGKSPEDIFHVTVMPCFDKKLEASRGDFLFPGTTVREVDCVISTAELDELIMTRTGSLAAAPKGAVDTRWFPTTDREGRLVVHIGGGSGGYAENVFRYAALKLFDIESPEIKYAVIRNKDFRELALKRGDEMLMRVATCYGFRNIQNFVQKLRRGRSNYDYVEVMACPSGCLNGGGQIRPENAEIKNELFEAVSKAYEDQCTFDTIVLDESVRLLAKDWFGEDGFQSEKARRLLYTGYHAVEKASVSLGIKW